MRQFGSENLEVESTGYSATGDTGEHVLIICWGSGANGRSTFLDTVGTLSAAMPGPPPRNCLRPSETARWRPPGPAH